MNVYRKMESVGDLWKIIGSFGEPKGKTEIHENKFFAKNGKITDTSEISKSDDGVFVRTGNA